MDGMKLSSRAQLFGQLIFFPIDIFFFIIFFPIFLSFQASPFIFIFFQ